jgi:hypothetical protein
MAQTMLCNGQYITNSPCYPVCPLPDGSGCDYSGVFGGGSAGGPTEPYSVTTGDAVAGNTSTTTHITPIDPYQSITPDMLNFGGNKKTLWFNQSGSNVIKVGGDTYDFEPVMSWDMGCDNLDRSGDGIFTNQNCNTKSGYGGVPGMRLSALRFKNGKMSNASGCGNNY